MTEDQGRMCADFSVCSVASCSCLHKHVQQEVTEITESRSRKADLVKDFGLCGQVQTGRLVTGPIHSTKPRRSKVSGLLSCTVHLLLAS